MKLRIVTLAGTLGALALGSSALAAPPTSPCKAPEVAKRGLKGTKIGNWQALAGKIGADGPGNNEAEAIASICKYGYCDASTQVLCVSEGDTRCFIKDPAGIWFQFDDVVESFENTIDLQTATSPDKRWLHVAASHEVLGRIEDAICEDDDEGNIECQSATGTYGHEYADLVIDLKTMTLAFDARISDSDMTATEDFRCKGKPSLAFSGDAFTYTGCNNRAVKLTLDDLGPCTVAARKAYSDAADTAFTEAKTAKRQAVEAAANKHVDLGRKATSAKKYDDAIAAFDAALAVGPFTAKAFSGRGYARLLRDGPGDLDAATKDFNRALEEETGDMKYRASVHFNLGLIAEKQKKPAEAKAWFKKAHGQNPSDATKKKLGIK